MWHVCLILEGHSAQGLELCSECVLDTRGIQGPEPGSELSARWHPQLVPVNSHNPANSTLLVRTWCK